MSQIFCLNIILSILSVPVSGLMTATDWRDMAATDTPVSEWRDNPLVIAHRGGAGIWPENTLLAFSKAVAMGVDMIEMDLQATADGVIVVLHDSSVDRTTNGTGRVSNLTWDEVQQFDAGYRWQSGQGDGFPFRDRGVTIPRLEEVFEKLAGIPLILEIKPRNPAIAEEVCNLITTFGRRDDVIVGSFHQAVLSRFRKHCPNVRTSASRQEAGALVVLNRMSLGRLHRPGAEYLQIPERTRGVRVLTPGLLRMARRHYRETHVWTINENDDLARMIHLGIDGIITDRPDRLMQLLERRTQRNLGAGT